MIINNDAPLIDDQYAIEIREQIQIVGDHAGRRRQRGDGFAHTIAIAQIQLGGWLVEDDQTRLAHQYGSQCHELSLASRQTEAAALGQMRDARLRQDDGNALGAFGRRHVKRLEAEIQVLAHNGENDLIVGVLENETHLTPDAACLAPSIETIDPHLPLLRQQQTIEQPGKGAFTSSIWADDAYAAFGQRQPRHLQKRPALHDHDHLIKLD